MMQRRSRQTRLVSSSVENMFHWKMPQCLYHEGICLLVYMKLLNHFWWCDGQTNCVYFSLIWKARKVTHEVGACFSEGNPQMVNKSKVTRTQHLSTPDVTLWLVEVPMPLIGNYQNFSFHFILLDLQININVVKGNITTWCKINTECLQVRSNILLNCPIPPPPPKKFFHLIMSKHVSLPSPKPLSKLNINLSHI